MKEKHLVKVRRRGSILDLFLIFLLLLSLLGAAMRYRELHRGDFGAPLAEYKLTVRLQSVDPHLSDCIAVDDAVYTAAGELYGRVSDIRVLPAQVGLFSEGDFVLGEWDMKVRCDLEVDIVFEGAESAGRVLWKGTGACFAGQSTALYTRRALLKGRILQVGIAP